MRIFDWQAKRAIEAEHLNAKRAINIEQIKAKRAVEIKRRETPPEGTFKLLGSRLNLGKLVRGAPYAATAVTESTRTLSDGNQIIHRNEAAYYRDSEGRTRMEQTLKQIGKWVSVGNPQRIIMIADPVAGYYFSLNVNERRATKTPLFNKVPSPEVLSEETEKQKASLERQRQQFEERRTRERQMFEERWEKRGRALTEQYAKSGEVQNEELAKQKRMIEEQRANERRAFDEQSAQQKQRFEQQLVEHKRRFEEQLKRRQGLDRSVPRLMPEKSSSGSSAAEGKPKLETALAQSDNRKRTEALGKRVVEGVEAEGTRTTVTIPAGEIGNTLPIHVVDESWYSRELQVPVLTRHLDPRAGENVFRLTDINRSEPARSLFEVPADYTIVENSRRRSPSVPVEPRVGPKPGSGSLPKPPAGTLEPVKPTPPKS